MVHNIKSSGAESQNSSQRANISKSRKSSSEQLSSDRFDEWIDLLSGKTVSKQASNGMTWHYTSTDSFRNDMDANLEYYHNYIQVMFPNMGKSAFSSCDLVVNEIFKTRLRERCAADVGLGQKIKQQMRLNFKRMLEFWGYDVAGDKDGITLIVSSNDDVKLKARKDKVDSSDNHNNLRITRVIYALRLFGLETEAELFWGVLQNSINSTSKSHWQEVVECMVTSII